ncbi:hypothetical protein R3P38DRAFT_3214017 [Favolaschia claudopus]|uniref:Uncharacterized protein n=1 Tax=Favolaschia claudopus TaxID=2862362 RepID=A0AAW0ACB0_9AGAR
MWTHFLKLHGKPKFNSSYWATYCKGCIQHEKELLQNTGTFDSVDWQHEKEINAEAELMEALADAEEDARLDEVYVP